MELRMNTMQLPDKISFNYEELKSELAATVSMYKTLVYTTEDEMKAGKADRAKLNKLRTALNDERIRLEKQYMKPFNEFKAEINELIKIIDEPVALIDKQLKEWDEKKKAEKIALVKEYFEKLKPIEGFETLKFEQIYNPRWQNATCSMRAIQDEIGGRMNNIKSDLAALQNLAEFSFEAIEVYKTSLDLGKAISEGQRLAEIQKRKAEQEQKKAEAELAKHMNPPVEEKEIVKMPDGGVYVQDDDKQGFTYQEPQEVGEWVSFRCYLTTTTAVALKEFLKYRGIPFERI